jgi:hypothetical protein
VEISGSSKITCTYELCVQVVSKCHYSIKTPSNGDSIHVTVLSVWVQCPYVPTLLRCLSWEEHKYTKLCKSFGNFKLRVWYESRDRAAGIATAYALDNRGVGVQVLVGSRIFLSPRPQTGSGANPASYSMTTAIDRSVKLTTQLYLVSRSRKRGSIRPLPPTPSWRSAHLVKHR